MRSRLAPMLLVAVLLAPLAACKGSDPLTAALPELPPTGGPVLATAGRLTDANFATEHIDGPASQGLVGDFFMRNDKVRVVLQAPGRAIGPCPYGGNIIDFDFVDRPAGDQLGEVSALFQLGRTLNALDAEIVRDGSKGGPAVLRFTGRDAWDDFINLRGLGSIAGIIPDASLPSVELGWQIAVTYILSPGATSVQTFYTFYNPTAQKRATTWGTISDTGAKIEIFHPGIGYGEVGFDAILGGGPGVPLVDYAALQGIGLAYGIVPVFADKTIRGGAVPVAGVNAEVYQLSSIFDAFSDAGSSLVVDAGGTASRELRVGIGRDVGDVTAQVRAIRGEATVAIGGTVTGNSAAGARVAVTSTSGDPSSAIVTTFTAGADGTFSGALPAGHYKVQAEGEALVRSPAVEIDLPKSDVALALPEVLPVRYTIHDRSGAAIPGKLMAIGARPNEPSSIFRDVSKDVLPYGIVAWSHSLSGVSTDAADPVSGADRALRLAAGQYRIVASRGPEWSRDERVITLAAPGAQIDAVLDHVVPTPGYAASDFHQHSNLSPDSPVPPEARVLSYVAEGIDFASTSDHDYLQDLRPIMQKVGATGLFDTAVGVETTTWDYGHYIAFPLPIDPASPNHGALDWAGGENIGMDGLNLPPPAIFDRLHQAGAQVVQVNHPRSTAGGFSNFQSSFDRAGLRFDFATHAFFGDKAIMPVEISLLALPPEAEMFGTGFDTLEIYNGFHVAIVDGERQDDRAELIVRDWMNFLSFGFVATPTGVSDTHTWIADPAGMPRTLVAVSDDSPASIAAGVGAQVANTLTGKAGSPRDVVVTNGPFVRFTVDGMGIGRTVAHTTGPLLVHVESHAPVWAPVDTVEVFANATFDIPSAKPAPLPPVLCFTSRATPSARCASAIGGARALPVVMMETVTGVAASARQDIVIDVNNLMVEELLARNRAGAVGKDLWLAARASGTQAMYPSVPNAMAKTPIADLVSGAAVLDEGVPAFALTGAIFVDADGGGWRGPFQP